MKNTPVDFSSPFFTERKLRPPCVEIKASLYTSISQRDGSELCAQQTTENACLHGKVGGLVECRLLLD